MSKTVVAIFDSMDRAETAAREIKDYGLRTDDISIVTKRDKSGSSTSSGRYDTEMSENVVSDNISDGAVTGGVLGGLAGLLIGAGSLVVPGLGIIAAAGPITGLISGAVTGGIVGGLVDLGIPEDKSKEYETDVKAGKILFSMKTDDDKINDVAAVLRKNSAVSVDTY